MKHYLVIQDGGATQWSDSQERNTGYVVGGKTTPIVVSKDDVRAFYTAINRRSLAYGSIGAWVDGDSIHVDAIEHYEDLDEALEVASMRGEQAIYDLAKKEDIVV